ncbi:MAG: thermonuclease family protein, partial [Mariprofundaceae bacterium]|nr:thermonuclease family protein [Mariprofundaceae bacterium]
MSWISDARWVTVAKVYDGDTFQTRQGEKIRFLNLNTPEVQHRDSQAQVGGNRAKKALTDLILGKQVRLRLDQEKKDRYGRTLAQVWMRDG